MYFFFSLKRKSTKKKSRGCALLLCTVPTKANEVVAAKGQGHIEKVMLGSSDQLFTIRGLRKAQQNGFRKIGQKMFGVVFR
jgi:hypothetical protein